MSPTLKEIRVLRGALKYILFQRTLYFFIHRNKVAKKILRFLPKIVAFFIESLFTTFNGAVAIEATIFGKEISRLFNEEMLLEFNSIKSSIPEKVESILDIGCGVGGIDVLLYKHYELEAPSIYLLDKTEMPAKVYYGLREKGCYYNSLAVTKKLLVGNGILPEKIFIQEATDDNSIDFNNQFDLIISLISWGFHYPVSVYLDQVYEKLVKGGILILDVRKGQGGLELLKLKFGDINVIHNGEKHDRVVAVKN